MGIGNDTDSIDPAVTPETAPPVTESKPVAVLTPELRAQVEREKKAAVENARAEEKRKLYAEIERVKTENKTLGEENSRMKIELDTTSTSTEKEKTTLRAMVNSLNEKVDLLTEQLHEASRLEAEEVAKLRVDGYKERRLRELSVSGLGAIIDAIDGNTEAEIERSIERQTQLFQRIVQQQTTQNQNSRTAAQLGGTPDSGPTSNAPATAQQPATLSADAIRNMSPEEYKRRRDEIVGASGVPVARERLRSR